MKKTLIALLLILSLLLSGCQASSCDCHTDRNDDQICDKCEKALKDCNEHKDKNGDTVCDYCKRSVIVTFDFCAINDLHGKIDDTDSQPGLDELTTYLNKRKTTVDNLVLLSTGDMWQGSSESNLTRGAMMTEWMNEMDFVSMTLGNHEYDWGADSIRANGALAEFPLLAINVYDTSTNTRPDYCRASVVLDLDGVQIGIIGAIGDVYSSIASDFTDGIEFKVGDELTKLVKDEAERLRGEGVDYVVYSLHDGATTSTSTKKSVSDKQLAPYYDIELSGGYVDLVFEGHTHRSYILEDSGGVLHLQGGAENDGFTSVQISINSVTGKTVTDDAEFIKQSIYKRSDSDPLIDELLLKYADTIAPAYRKLGYNPTTLNSSSIKQLVAELYYEFGNEVWGDEYNLFLGGGYLSVRNPYNLYKGEVTYSDVYTLLPFDNQIVLCSIKGEDLYYNFIATENEDYYVYLGEYGKSIKDSIDFNATYYVVTDTYTSTYAPNNMTEIERYSEDVFARDLLAEYIENIG